MKTSKIAVLLAGMVFAIFLSAFSLPTNEVQPSGYDLAAAVNAYRAANGYYQLNPHSLVMAAAQAHAEWIVETGQGGHIGASGSDETVRVSWTGYGGGASIQCDENWASGSTIEDAVYSAWSDWTHQEVMLNAWGNRYTDIGGGAAAYGDGRYAFVLNVCKVVGQESSGDMPEASGSAPPANGNTLATADSSNYIYGVTLATPLADGTLTHTVLYGQTLAAIAKAYGITIETLRDLNNIPADSTIIWVDEELIIQPAGTVATYTQESTLAETDNSPAANATAAMQPQMPQPS
ncbi:MAG: LysM domain-containing protein, partial [Anaerolineales bacterium]|nr:LysM domain-containing protein [Anaerolineales bacterium]